MSKDEEYLSQEETMAQLVVIKTRLETYPLANHEVICLKDCMLLLIRTFAGEKIPELQLARVGGGTMESGPVNNNSEFINGEMRRGGVEIAPGVMQYPAAQDSVTMDVEASLGELNSSLEVTKAPPPEMPKPVAGSMMAQAFANARKDDASESQKISQDEQAAVAEIERQVQGTPEGIPAPSDTRVEITS